MADEELKITIDDADEPLHPADPDLAAKLKGTKTAAATVIEQPVEALKTQLTELTQTADRERARASAAERRAADLERENAETQRRATASDLTSITTSLEATNETIEQAKRDIKQAKADGDADAEVDAIARMSVANATLLRLEEGKADAEARAKAPPKRAPVERSSDPVEAYAAGRTDKTAAWIRAHPQFVGDPSRESRLTAAHYNAEANGHAPDTPGYFADIEKFLGVTKEADVTRATPTEAEQVQPKRAAAPPVAPAAATANGGTAPANEVRLRKSEADRAVDGTIVWNWTDPNGKFKKGDPIGVQEYARRKQKMQQSGQYDRVYTDS